MAKRVFLIVLDSFGIGAEPDADRFGDVGSNTLKAVAAHPNFKGEHLAELGLFHIDGVHCGERYGTPIGSFARLREASAGKDTTIGHWEIAGLVSAEPLPTFPEGFPKELLDEFTARTGYQVLCNKPYSGTQVIRDYGEEHMRTGALIVYTSADSVFQIAANEAVVPIEKLYEICKQAREMLKGKYGVGRVIARPFVGDCADNFTRTSRRHDYSLLPPRETVLDKLQAAGRATIGVGKIHDIFAGKGISETIRTSGNTEGMQVALELADRDFEGLAFVNLVDFDMLYGHRRDVAGYAAALAEFNDWLPAFMQKMRPDDVLMITADHGCDPSYTKTTDHTREYVPYLVYGAPIRPGVDLGTRYCFGTIANTVCEYLGVDACLDGCGVMHELAR
ncbi:MAG TPA: phosphopentomutase [Candidatus Gemmiger faecigallinarum]|nr:phosphopentomutase [Candidatus Gemmiger faecigallinarum]